MSKSREITQLGLVFGKYLAQTENSVGRVAKLIAKRWPHEFKSPVGPKRTLEKWLGHEVKRPHKKSRRLLLQASAIMNLHETEVNELLQTIANPNLNELRLQSPAYLADIINEYWPLLVPFQAPVEIPYFAGRKHLLTMVGQTIKDNNYAFFGYLSGMPGVGKTSLVLRLVYQLRSHFSDGVLWVKVDQANVMATLQMFALAYGEDVTQYQDLEIRKSVVRNILVKKRCLIILDNAETSEQIEHLLPPSGLCCVLVTTRRQDLAILDGWHRFEVEPFDKQFNEALELFENILGKTEVATMREHLYEIANLLGNLPLALAIICGYLAQDAGKTKSVLEGLQKDDLRLEQLVRENRSVRLSFDLSYDALPADQQKLFLASGTFAGEYALEAIAAVAQIEQKKVQVLLEDHLYTRSLVQKGQYGRYRLHPLLRDYAREKLDIDDPIWIAMIMYYHDFIATNLNNYDLLQAEVVNIEFAFEMAVNVDMIDTLVRMANQSAPFFEYNGLYQTALQPFAHLEQMADLITNEHELAQLHYRLGRFRSHLGDYNLAQVHFLTALDIVQHWQNSELIHKLYLGLAWIEGVFTSNYEQTREYLNLALPLAYKYDDLTEVRRSLFLLGNVQYSLGNREQAEAYWQKNLDLTREINAETQETVRVLMNLGMNALDIGKDKQSANYFHRAAVLANRLQHPETLSTALVYQAISAMYNLKPKKAETYLQQGLEISQRINKKEVESFALRIWGELATDQENFELAARNLNRAVSISQQNYVPWDIQDGLIRRGNLFLAQNDLKQAVADFEKALGLTRQDGHEELEALALFGLAQVEAKQNHLTLATQLARESLIILEKLNHRNRIQVKTFLQDL